MRASLGLLLLTLVLGLISQGQPAARAIEAG